MRQVAEGAKLAVARAIAVENCELHGRLTTDHPEIDSSAMRAEWLQHKFVITISWRFPATEKVV